MVADSVTQQLHGSQVSVATLLEAVALVWRCVAVLMTYLLSYLDQVELISWLLRKVAVEDGGVRSPVSISTPNAPMTSIPRILVTLSKPPKMRNDAQHLECLNTSVTIQVLPAMGRADLSAKITIMSTDSNLLNSSLWSW